MYLRLELGSSVCSPFFFFNPQFQSYEISKEAVLKAPTV